MFSQIYDYSGKSPNNAASILSVMKDNCDMHGVKDFGSIQIYCLFREKSEQGGIDPVRYVRKIFRTVLEVEVVGIDDQNVALV